MEVANQAIAIARWGETTTGYREHFSSLIWVANSGPHAGALRSFRTTPGRWLQCNNLNFNDSGDHLWRLLIRHSRLQPVRQLHSNTCERFTFVTLPIRDCEFKN